MHDLVCDVAFEIASKDNVFALKHDAILQDWPDGDRMKMFNMINLDRVSISEFPEGLDCPQLTFFHMHSKVPIVQMPFNFFMEMRNLKVLDLTNLHFPSLLPSSISFLTNLRTLCLDCCVLGDIALIGELKNLESLSLLASDIETLPKEIGQLAKLRLFDLRGCTKLKVIVPGVLSNLSRLEELYLGESFMQWEVERHDNRQTNATLAELKLLSCLTSLEIHIPDASIMPGDLFFEKLEIYKIFIGKAWAWAGEYEYSRTLKLELNRSIHHLDDGIKILLKKTEDLHLDDMKGAKVALHGLIDDDDGFQHLKNLHIRNCVDIQYIINGAMDSNEFLQLQSLTLESLPQLISFSCDNPRSSTSGSQHELSLFSEKNLRLSSINVEWIWRRQLSDKSFCTLTSLIVEGCGNLKHLLSSSMARSLVNLECFEIIECKCLKEIIFSEEQDINEEVILFPRLNSLKIKDLQHLVGFCYEDYRIEFPSLKLLEIENCPAVKGFVYESTAEENQHLSSRALFDEKVTLPKLEKMSISHLRNMKMIWHNQLSGNSFCKLTELVVENCSELSKLFPSGMWSSTFGRLQILTVSSCGSLEEIFEVQGLNMEERQVVATQFRELHIKHLPKLKLIWSKDLGGILTFRNLSVVQVWGCWSLKNVFPASTARSLPQLKDLQIGQCRVEEIVAAEEGLRTWISFEFDQLSSLTLWELPELKCFYPGMHTTKWPMLKRLETYHCDKVKIFDLDMNDKDDGQHHSPTQRQQSLLSLQKVVTRLEEVCLNGDDIAMISDNNKFSRGHFRGIKALKVLCYHDESAIFPISFLERFNNLEKLEVGCCGFKELFSCEGATTVLVSIKKLRLVYLFNLKQIWRQESERNNVLPNLETLEVYQCYTLTNLGLSLAPFQNLMTLDVWKCTAMASLVTSSSAIQILVQLKTLKIRECASMKTVVGNMGGEATCDDIVFNRLTHLELRNLASLKCFCSGNHRFSFPSLQHITVIQCPEVEFFCKGVLNVPMLRSLQATVEDEKGHWGGDLNSTVKQLYRKKVGFHGYILLSDFSKSTLDLWRQNLQDQTLDFTNLTVLEVKDCSSLTFIFTVSMALSLVQLNELKVNNCPAMEQIIRNGGEEATVSRSRIMLPSLQSIALESCSSLISFLLGSNTLECLSLRRMTIVDCPKMFHFTSALSRELDMETIGVNASFFNDKVLCPNLECLELSSLNIKKIWPDQSQVTSYDVQNLKVFVVKDCHSLKYILPSSLSNKLAQLDLLRIHDCTNVEEVICTERLMAETQSIEAESTSKFVFPKIRFLVLDKLPKLKCFYSRIHATELKGIRVFRCNKVETFAKDFLEGQGESQLEIFQQPLFWVTEDTFPNLEWLQLEANGSMEELWHRELPTKYFPKLSWLSLFSFPKNTTALPNCFIQSLPNLEKLEVSESFFNEIFQCEALGVRGEVEHVGALAQLKKLRLSKLPELRHIWKGGIPPAEVFSNLVTLKVLECGKLDNVLVSSSVSFKNLTKLKVSECHGLENLVTLPTARSMMSLERLSVTDCQAMKEIIASTSDEEMDDIIFSKLKSIELGNLPSLSRFSSGNYTFGFPSLEELIMKQCPKMEIFSEGELSTPMLQGIQSTKGEYVGCWEGDLNAIIQQLFVEKLFPGMEDLE